MSLPRRPSRLGRWGRGRYLGLINGVVRQDGAVAVTRGGTPVAVLLTPERYDSMAETLSVLGDAPLVRDISEALHGT